MKKNLLKVVIGVLSTAFLASCGGGGEAKSEAAKEEPGKHQMALPSLAEASSACCNWWGIGPDAYGAYEFKCEAKDGWNGNVLSARFKENDGARYAVYAIDMKAAPSSLDYENFKTLKKITIDYTCDMDLTDPDDPDLATIFQNDFKAQFVFKGYNADTGATDMIYYELTKHIQMENTFDVKTLTIDLTEDEQEAFAEAMAMAIEGAVGHTVEDPDTGALKPVNAVYWDWFQLGFFQGDSMTDEEIIFDIGFKVGNICFYTE